MTIRKRTYSGVKEDFVSEREIRSQALSRKAAGEGVVLLKNQGLLPLNTDQKLILFGNGVSELKKGGTGSGDVNVRRVISVYEGLTAAGYSLINGPEIVRYMEACAAAEVEWTKTVKAKMQAARSDMEFLSIPSHTPKLPVTPLEIRKEQVEAAAAVIYVISRIAGEGRDRDTLPGDFFLSEKEEKELSLLAACTDKIVLVLNTGAQIDLGAWGHKAAAILYLSQPGMEAGHVLADVLSGKVNPSGHLTTTWCKKYEDFPNAATFSHCNGDTDHERYIEGIYVGYRYFDAFGVEPLYPFGYGLSYTSFQTTDGEVSAAGNRVTVTAKVTNTGKAAGKQVVQVYAACPQGKITKEVKRLIGYGKTRLLSPGESETLEITADPKTFASYSYEEAAWILEKGLYGIFLGEDAERIQLVGVLQLEKDVLLEKVSHIAPLQEELQEIQAPETVLAAFTKKWQGEGLKPLAYHPTPDADMKDSNAVPRVDSTAQGTDAAVSAVGQEAPSHPFMARAKEIAAEMNEDELIAMLMGEITKGQDNVQENELVETGIFVPGAAGETSCRFEEKYGIPGVSMADGPAAMTRGVQSLPGCGTTIKHYAANNQEDNRKFSDSIVSERALREIYLRGFELAVKESQPMCLMTSYNRINGIPAANQKDLITTALRKEWGFQGIVMSDWTTTNRGSAEAYLCPEAGNDLIMPGSDEDIASMKQAILKGKLTRTAMEECASRLISLLLEINEALLNR